MINTSHCELMLMLLGIGARPAVAQKATATCPAEAPATREIAVHLATSSGSAATRARHQLPTLTESQVRLLSAAQGDGTTCGKLTTLVQSEGNGVLNSSSMRVSYFTGGGSLYYIVGVRTTTVQSDSVKPMSTGFQVLWVVDTKAKPKVVAKLAV